MTRLLCQRQTLCVLVTSLLLLLSVSTSMTAQQWDGTSSPWSAGDGSADNPYIISDPQHLAYLSQMVREGEEYAGQYFLQTTDLDMGATTHDTLSVNFYPIGIYDAGFEGADSTPFDHSKRFSGIYDGGYHKISNLYQHYDNDGVSIGGHGLFGYVGSQGEVKHLYLDESCTLTGGDNGGSLVSYLEGHLTGCLSAATIRGRMQMGGLVGICTHGVIADCAFTGYLFGTSMVGGISGMSTMPEPMPADSTYLASKSTYTDLYVNAQIECSFSGVGSAFGFIVEPFVAHHIYTTGELMGSGFGSFLSGAFGACLDTYAIDGKDQFDIQDCYYDSSFGAKDTSDGELPHVESKSATDMQTANFATLIGSHYRADLEQRNGGFAVLVAHDPFWDSRPQPTPHSFGLSRGAFLGAEKLIQIILPKDTEMVGDKAFALCTALRNITIAPAEPTAWGDEAIPDQDGLEVYVASTDTKEMLMAQYAFQRTKIIVVNDGAIDSPTASERPYDIRLDGDSLTLTARGSASVALYDAKGTLSAQVNLPAGKAWTIELSSGIYLLSVNQSYAKILIP